jgi:hypothetical protein
MRLRRTGGLAVDNAARYPPRPSSPTSSTTFYDLQSSRQKKYKGQMPLMKASIAPTSALAADFMLPLGRTRCSLP